MLRSTGIRLALASIGVGAVFVTGSALATTDVLAPKVVRVKATEYAYAFSSKTAKKGQKVRIVMKNAGTEVHDLKFTGVAPKSKFIPGGASTTFTVVFKKTGRYQYVCTIGEHAIKGMMGVFIVKA